MTANPSLEPHLIPSLPLSAYYFPNFLTLSESEHILTTLNSIPPHKWISLSHRRLLSLPSPLAGTAKDTLISQPLPPYLTDPIIPRFTHLSLFYDSPHNAPNHCLVNEYLPGQGIMPHTDGPAYHPITATVSLGSHTVLDIYDQTDTTTTTNDTQNGHSEAPKPPTTRKPKYRILQEPLSLLITTGDLYTQTLHGIAEVATDEDLGPETIVNWELLGDKAAYERGSKSREPRVSLTYRDVKKVTKLGGVVKFLGKR